MNYFNYLFSCSNPENFTSINKQTGYTRISDQIPTTPLSQLDSIVKNKTSAPNPVTQQEKVSAEFSIDPDELRLNIRYVGSNIL